MSEHMSWEEITMYLNDMFTKYKLEPPKYGERYLSCFNKVCGLIKELEKINAANKELYICRDVVQLLRIGIHGWGVYASPTKIEGYSEVSLTYQLRL